MCGRYERRADKQRIAEWFHTHNTDVFNDEYYEINSTRLAPSHNISTESIQPIVRLDRDTGERVLALTKWGLVPYWSKTPKANFSSINARSFEFFGGTSQLVIRDNLKSSVTKPCYYEPEMNRTYGDLAIHYGVGILPARPYRPRDKAKAEVGVQIVQRWVLATLRKRQFFSLADLNEAILELVHKLTERPFRKLAGSRAELYQVIDRPALQPLPLQPFVFAEWKKARVNLDYHIELGGHYYSTPYQLVGKEVDTRSTQGTVEIFCQGKRVASHVRSSKAHVASTDAGHRPKSHQQYLEWTPTRIVEWAAKVGPFTARLVESIMTSKPHPEMGYRSALGVIRLERKYGAERLEAACTRAVRLKLYRFQSVKSMLESGLDRQPLPELLLMPSPVTHESLRGPGYYAAQQTRREVGQC
jgi:transposase